MKIFALVETTSYGTGDAFPFIKLVGFYATAKEAHSEAEYQIDRVFSEGDRRWESGDRHDFLCWTNGDRISYKVVETELSIN